MVETASTERQGFEATTPACRPIAKSRASEDIRISGLQRLDAVTHVQHNGAMKTAILPQVRVEPQLRAELESVLREGETLSDFLVATVRRAVEHRQVEAEFSARADAAWARFQATGEGVPVEEVIAKMGAKLDARRRELAGKHRPADA